MIDKVSNIGVITNDKHDVNKMHKKKNNHENITSDFQSILDIEKIKVDERILNKNIK